MKARRTFTSRDVRAGCFVCHGSEAQWYGGQAQGTAAQHHDRTGHATWCDVVMSVRYGRTEPDARQIDIEDSIAAHIRSGGEPDAAPLTAGPRQSNTLAGTTDPDATAVAPAGVSAPKGRPVETPAHKQRGARGRKPEHAHA